VLAGGLEIVNVSGRAHPASDHFQNSALADTEALPRIPRQRMIHHAQAVWVSPGIGGKVPWLDPDDIPAGRILAQGDLRLIVLSLIAEAPRHGYGIIKLIEEKTADWYSPSFGIVYPALTFVAGLRELLVRRLARIATLRLRQHSSKSRT
jgi:hypothetical protein